MITDNDIQELQNDIKVCDKLIGRHPENANAYYEKASLLMKLGKYTGDNSYYPQALECYSQAIKLSPYNHLYFADRSKLYSQVGETNLADADIKQLSELPEPKDKLIEMYIRNIIQQRKKIDAVDNSRDEKVLENTPAVSKEIEPVDLNLESELKQESTVAKTSLEKTAEIPVSYTILPVYEVEYSDESLNKSESPKCVLKIPSLNKVVEFSELTDDVVNAINNKDYAAVLSGLISDHT